MNTHPTSNRTPRRALARLKIACGIILFSSIMGMLKADDTSFLSVDIGSTDTRYKQSGWSIWNAAGTSGEGISGGSMVDTFTLSDTSAVSSGALTVTISSSSGTLLERGRDLTTFSSTFQYTPLYADVVIASGKNATLTVSFSGLNASTAYTLTFYALDTNSSDITTVSTVTGTELSNSGQINYTSGAALGYTADTPLSVAASTLVATTDSSGALVFSVKGTASANLQGFLNGFQIATAGAIPEPGQTAAGIGFCALVSVFIIRRFRASRRSASR